MIFYCTSKAIGYDGSFNFSSTDPKYNSSFYISLRRTSAIASSFIAPLITTSLMLQHISTPSSVLAGFISTFDYITVTQSRLILTDSFLYLFVTLTIFASSLLYRKQKLSYMILQAFFAGCAISVKFTAGGVLAYIAAQHIYFLYRQKGFFLKLVGRGILIATIAFSVLFATIFIHFKLLTKPGYGDLYFNSEFKTYGFFRKAVTLIYLMIKYNRSVTSDHPAATRWYQWPLSLYGALPLWNKDGIIGLNLYINLTATVFAFLGAITGIYNLELESIGYLCSYIPFIFIKRSTFLYHYEIPVIFGIFCSAKFIDDFNKEDRDLTAKVISITAACVFLLFVPNVYGIYSPITL